MEGERATSFLDAFAIGRGSVVCLVGAGGKTSLLFRLGIEARQRGFRTLVSTTTKIFSPSKDQYDEITVTRDGDMVPVPDSPGLYVAGSVATPVKIGSLRDDVLSAQRDVYDLILLEADGAACKSLKGWKDTEPVIPGYTTHTIGIVDITTIGRTVSDSLVHRLPIFTELTGAVEGDIVLPVHLQKMILHPKGLFFQSRGKQIVYFNKVESAKDLTRALELQQSLPGCCVCKGSVQRGELYQ